MTNYSFRQALDDIGAVLAGFQVAVSIVSFFGIGAFASWVIERWLPFTRWVWTEVISLIKFPDISDPEKDALTAVAFFIPMAVSALLNGKTFINIGIIDKAKSLRVRIFTLFVGVIFLYLVGSRVIFDMVDMFNSFDFAQFENISQIALMLAVLPLVYLSIIYLRVRYFDKSIKKDGDDYERLKENIEKSLSLSTLVSYVIFLIFIGGSSILLAMEGIGWIRALAPLLVIVCLGITIIFHPNRLLNAAGVVFAFVLSSFAWELVLLAIEIIEKSPFEQSLSQPQ